MGWAKKQVVLGKNTCFFVLSAAKKGAGFTNISFKIVIWTGFEKWRKKVKKTINKKRNHE